MRRLEENEIERFASVRDAQCEIVRRILSGIGPDSATDINDLFFLARTQGWHRSTVTAILEGIAHAATPPGRRELKDPLSSRDLTNMPLPRSKD